jgi:uncharacterized protein YdeI (YjbR/CyaY-like superfamily)
MEEQLLFPDRDAFRKWLSRHHNDSQRVWLIFGKAGKLKTLRPDEALEEAICFGWIDELIKSVDATKYLKRFARRTKGSKWSERNKGIAEKLIKNGKMTEHGIKAIEEAKKGGTWDMPKREPVLDTHIETLIKDINGVEPALSNYLKMPLSIRKVYAAFYLNAKKEETKIRRLQNIIKRLNQNKKPMD